MDWIENQCACGANEVEPLFVAEDLNFHATAETGTVVRCSRCGSIFPTTSPTEQTIGDAYSDYYTKGRQEIREKRRIKRRILDVARRGYDNRSLPRTASSVLDYGCGSGGYLAHLSDKGTSAKLFGTDIFSVQNASELGFEFIEIEGLKNAGHRFDHITLSHVIEHVHSPETVVLLLKDLVAPGGTVWISTPNARSFLISSFGRFARDVDFPRHIHVFSDRCLRELLEGSGFEVDTVSPPRVNSALNFVSSLRNVWKHDKTGQMMKIRISLLATFALLANLLTSRGARISSAGEIVLLCRL